MSDCEKPDLLTLLGGETGCKRLARRFYERVATSLTLKPLFPGKSLRCATEEFAAFLIQFLDGDPNQTQYRWWLSLRESHARFQITAQQRSAWLGLMDETIDDLGHELESAVALKNFFRSASSYLLGQADGELEPSELKQRWCQQKQLDCLIEDIVKIRDGEAIALARQFLSRPSVFVGILARMMTTGRQPLLDFAYSSICYEPKLSESRFNGRTLLHFAAGSSSIDIVRLLLQLGVDPDILDQGEHTPLYRVGSSKKPMSARVVFELANAGANVDHCGGVSRSTALHEAVRHGNLVVAQALLNAGASTKVKDRRGFTPLDRARNCRRWEVAALLHTLT